MKVILSALFLLISVGVAHADSISQWQVMKGGLKYTYDTSSGTFNDNGTIRGCITRADYAVKVTAVSGNFMVFGGFYNVSPALCGYPTTNQIKTKLVNTASQKDWKNVALNYFNSTEVSATESDKNADDLGHAIIGATLDVE